MMFDISPNSAIPGNSGNNFDLGAASRKRSIDEHSSAAKRARWYYRLESESSRTSEEDTESIYSLQGHETELVQDTPDTESKSEDDSSGEVDDKSDYDLEVEYEVASLSEDEHPAEDASSSGTDDMLAAAGAIAAVICDTSMEPWLTDGEDSDNSSVGEAELNRTDFWTCIQCKSQNNNPLYRYCQECFQVRKNRFPPRPRGRRRKRKMPVNKPRSRKLPNQATASQDSGIGSSQDFQSVEFDVASTSAIETVSTTRGTKRKYSSASESTENDIRDESKQIKCKQDDIQSEKNQVKSENEGEKNEEDKAKIQKDEVKSESDNRCLNNIDEIASQAKDTAGKPQNLKSTDKALGTLPEYKELCIICNDKAKNSIFLHGKIGHMCSCYECAIRCWQSHKRCPACNRKVSNVVRVFKV